MRSGPVGSRPGDGGGGKGVPRNLLHNIPHESGALAEVALGARDAGLHLARGDLLYTRKPGQPVFLLSNPSIHVSLPTSSSLIFPRIACGGGFRGGRTWPLLRPMAMPDFCLTSWGIVAVVVGRCRRWKCGRQIELSQSSPKARFALAVVRSNFGWAWRFLPEVSNSRLHLYESSFPSMDVLHMELILNGISRRDHL